jgi:hypothetical protein
VDFLIGLAVKALAFVVFLAALGVAGGLLWSVGYLAGRAVRAVRRVRGR